MSKPKGKLPLNLITPEMSVALASALETGALKYGPRDYLSEDIQDIQAALLRHLTRYNMGEALDPESGYPHIWHVFASAAIMVDIQASKIEAVKSLLRLQLARTTQDPGDPLKDTSPRNADGDLVIGNNGIITCKFGWGNCANENNYVFCNDCMMGVAGPSYYDGKVEVDHE